MLWPAGLQLRLVSGIQSAMRKVLAFLWRPSVSLWGSVGIFTLYFLSTGPFIWLVMNVQLPEWMAVVLTYFYCPISWAFRHSEFLQTIVLAYVGLWADVTGAQQPATPDVLPPAEPPFFVEVSGALVGAWLLWNFIRWINQLKTPNSA
jgi:hypothetical protein